MAQAVARGKKTLMFPDAQSAMRFLNASQELPRGSLRSAHTLDWMASAHGGMLSTDGFYDRSSTGRELEIYGQQPMISVKDREYLHERDPTVRMINSRVPEDTWVGFPTTYDTEIDTLFDDLMAMNAHTHIAACDESQRIYGGAFLYHNYTGHPSEPVTPRDSWLGVDIIELKDIVPNSLVLSNGRPSHPLITHGVERLTFDPNGDPLVRVLAPGETDHRMVIHGSRLTLLRETKRGRALVGRPILDAFFDPLRDLRDLAFSMRLAQTQGNPIALDIDTEMGFHLTQTAQDMIQENMEDFQDNSRDVFGGIAGVKVRRIGSMDLDDPEPALRLAAARISHVCEFPINMLLASTKGSEAVTDRDILEFEGRINTRRSHFARAVLNNILRHAQFVGMVGKRRSLPREMDWPRLRMMNPRDEAFVAKSDASTIKMALGAGYLPKGRVMSGFVKNTVPIDTSTILPSSIKSEQEDDRADVEVKQGDRQLDIAEKVADKPAPKPGGDSE